VLWLLPAACRLALAQDAANANDLGLILSAEDHRSFDGPFFVRMAQHPDSLVRIRAAMAMGRIGDRGATAVLAPMLADRDSVVRVEAAFALGKLGDRGAVPELASLAARFPPVASGEFVIEVVTALAKLGGPDAERALGAILDRHPATMA